jgi:hypothetical protein
MNEEAQRHQEHGVFYNRNDAKTQMKLHFSYVPKT